MSEDQLGRTECVSIALGGMVGGGIFAALGVVVQIAGAAAWIAFVLAGVVALCAGYSFNHLNGLTDRQGGSVTFVQELVGSSTAAGMTGWTLLVGYVGSMAMYAYAFGSFTVGFAAVPETLGPIPSRPIVSVAMVAGFLGLNLLGAGSTGTAENVMVGAKLLILFLFGAGGIYYGSSQDALAWGWSEATSFTPVMAGAISFVAFQGWQLLYYDQERIADPVPTVRTAVYVAIPSAIALYVIVAVSTVSLAPMEVIRQHPERALAVAADPFIPYGFTIISLSALFSTGSALNATLFSSGYFAKGMLSSDLLPDRIGDPGAQGLPVKTVIVLAALTAAFSTYGSLSAITSFASLAFIVVFGGVCLLALREHDRVTLRSVVPGVGAIGSLGFFVLMLWHLFQAERETFYAVLAIAVAVVTVELFYFERETIEKELEAAKNELEEIEEKVEEDLRGEHPEDDS